MAGDPIAPTATGAWGQTAIIPLWVPVVVFAHVFAAFWLLKTWMLNAPAVQRKVRQEGRAMSKLAKQASQKLRAGLKQGSAAGATVAAGKAGRTESLDDAAGNGAAAGDQVAIQ
ncbi:hypothetical protein MNEG_7906, partial [Monoraphidium neglectum]